jgi:hypothetical protein
VSHSLKTFNTSSEFKLKLTHAAGAHARQFF